MSPIHPDYVQTALGRLRAALEDWKPDCGWCQRCLRARNAQLAAAVEDVALEVRLSATLEDWRSELDEDGEPDEDRPNPEALAAEAAALREELRIENDEARAALAAAEAERDRGNQALALMEEASKVARKIETDLRAALEAAQERERVLAKAVEDVALEDLKPCVDAFDGKDMADVPTYVQTALGRLRAALEAREVSP